MREPKFWMAVSGGANRFDGGPEWIYPEGIQDGDYVFYYKRTIGIVGAGTHSNGRYYSHELDKPIDPVGLWEEPDDLSGSGPLDAKTRAKIIQRIENDAGGVYFFRKIWAVPADSKFADDLNALGVGTHIRGVVPGDVRKGDKILIWIDHVGFSFIMGAITDAQVSRKKKGLATLMLLHKIKNPLSGTLLSQHPDLVEWLFVGQDPKEPVAVTGTKYWPALRVLLHQMNPDVGIWLTSLHSPTPYPVPHLHRHLLSDAPTHIDRLGFAPIVDALHTFLKTRNTELPIVIAVDAPWGRGKSSFMKMLERKMQPPPRKEKMHPPHLSLSGIAAYIRKLRRGQRETRRIPNPRHDTDRKFETVYFNAWRHGTGTRLTGGLVFHLLQELPARLKPHERELFWLRRNYERIDVDRLRRTLHIKSARKLLPYVFGAVVVAAGVAAGLAYYFGKLTGLISGGLTFGTILTLWAAARTYFRAALEYSTKPVDFDLEPYIRAPDYTALTGPQLQIEADFLALAREFRNRDRTLVVFIDDLDRCAPGDVAGFVESINVFFGQAVKNCIFILGMHKPFVEASLEVAYADLIAKLDAKQLHDELPFGQRFLEKIVQFIIYLPEADIQAVHDYIDHLSGFDPRSGPAVLQAPQPATPATNTPAQDAPPAPGNDIAASLRDAAAIKQLSEEYDERTPEIAAVFRAVRDALRSNPRQYVRFFNALRFQYDPEIQRTRERPDSERLLLLAKGTTLSLEWPEQYIQHGGDAKQLQAFIDSPGDGVTKDERLQALLNATIAEEKPGN